MADQDKTREELLCELEALRESERKFRLIVENATEGIFVAQDGVMRYANDVLLEVSGYDADELSHAFFAEFIHPDDQQMVMDRYLKRLRGEAVENTYTFRAYTKQREELSIQISSVGITWEGRPATLNFLRDITPQKRLESKLRQALRLEAIGTLAGGIAHDFNNILGAIIGYAQMAYYVTEDSPPAQESLRQVIQASRRAKELVKRVVAFSRQTEEPRQRVSVQRIVQEALSLLRASLPATIEIQEQITADSTTVLADPTSLHQVLMNLCTNAQHAMMETGGLLEVTLVPVDLDADSATVHPELDPGPYVKLSVRDTGHGMDAATMEHCFDPYWTTKDQGMGTGMGLAVVHGIVKSHGGGVMVRSKRGKGSVFDVFLPRAAGEDIEEEAFQFDSLQAGTERILFVDDEEPLVTMVIRMLTSLGYRITGWTKPRDALQAFQGDPEQYDLVVTDLTMPHLTGDQLASEMLRIRPDLPVVLCTGFADRLTEIQARKAGFQAYLKKPFELQDLTRVIRAVLDRSTS